MDESSGSVFLWQATGMVSEQLGVSVDRALARLEARATEEDRTLLDLARDVIAGRVRFVI
jgi:hypothetical protein